MKKIHLEHGIRSRNSNM
ncbi:hypothetical protein Gotri_016555 [Gossypium trilobum]|uniref:Uncharacterized protein n=1 Tax=Gossypium trilobum TaxID=34281 RepID=A0A7J9E4K1_9ROSI|nr:hypothetical protein [Gossypium trilobum]